MPAVRLFRGPYHVMEYANDQAMSLRDGRGMPVAECFPEKYWVETLAAMDEAFRSASIVRRDQPLGTLIVGPRFDDRGRVFGVATWFLPAAQLVAAQPQTNLPEPLPLEGRAG